MVPVVGPPLHQVLAFQAGQGAGQGLGLQPFGRGERAGCHRAAPVQVAEDAQRQVAQLRSLGLGAFHPQPPGQPGAAPAYRRRRSQQVLVRHRCYASTY